MSELKNTPPKGDQPWRSALEAVADEKRRDLGPHPDLDALVAYHAGDLAASEAQALQDHLVLCPRCAELLLELDAFAVDAATTPQPAAAAEVVPIARRRVPRLRRWGVAAAAVAASVLFVIWSRLLPGEAIWPRGGPLPDYALRLEGGVSATRNVGPDAETSTSRVVTGEPLALKLQPATAVKGPITARAYLRRGAELRPLSAATLEIGTAGVVTVAGIVGADLQLPTGDNALLLAVARLNALPSRQRLQSQLETSRSSRWIGVERKIRVIEPAADSAASLPSNDLSSSDLPSEDGGGPWIEYAGCRTIETGPICILPADRRLTLWVGHPRAEDIRIDAGSWWRSHSPTAVQGGYRYQVQVGRWTSELVVEVQGEEKRSIWVLELGSSPAPDWWLRAHELYSSDAWDEARLLLEPRTALPDPAVAGPALSLLARIERRSGHSKLGDALYRRAIDAHRRAGRLADQIKDVSGFTYYLIEEKRFAEVRELLDTLPVSATGGSAEARSTVAYLRGLLAEETGDLRAAMAWMARAAREAERVGIERRWIFAMDILARQLNTVGLSDAASDLYARMRSRIASLCDPPRSGGAASVLSACDCARFDVSRAWAGLLALEAGGTAPDPGPAALLDHAEQALMAQEARGAATCVAPEDLPNLRLNRALAALHAGDSAAARRHLNAASVERQVFPRLALWQLDIEGRILLAESRPSAALELYGDLARRAELNASPEAAWRAAFGRATAFEALARTDDALVACAEAEDQLARESLLVPMHTGRERFIAQRDHASRFCLDLLLRQGRGDEALGLVQRSALRALRGLRVGASVSALRQVDRKRWRHAVSVSDQTRHEMEDLAGKIWQGLPQDEEERLILEIKHKRQALRELFDVLVTTAGSDASAPSMPAPPDGVVILAYHPLPFGWAALAADADGVTAHRIEPASEIQLTARSEEELAALLLEPFAENLRRATEIQVIPYGAMRAVDVHALPFDGDILLSHAPVVYRLGLPLPPATTSDSSKALVVAGPGLLAAAAEIRAVQRALEARADAWQVELLADEAATGRQVRQRLQEVALFHYAGHAEFDDATRGWNSHLMLASGGRLTVDDILALPHVPRWVVLSGCETGRDARTTPVPGIGLAQAFLVAGSEAVVAATAEVADAEAAVVMERLYHHWDASTPLAAAFAKALLERRDQTQAPDWRRFRILTRH